MRLGTVDILESGSRAFPLSKQ